MSKKQQHNDQDLLPVLRAIARGAGAIIMDIYNKAAADDAALGTAIKDDASPVTVADKLSSGFIERSLRRLTPDIPVVCEENATDFAPGSARAFWAVDPLDGTKEFIGRTGGFAVNIALLRDNVPVAGVVYSPAQDTIYYTAKGLKSWRRTGTDVPVELHTRPALKRPGGLTTLFNKTHADPELYARQRARMAARGVDLPADPQIIPGLPRNLQVAAGAADLHLVTGKDATLQGGGGYVWDNAANWLLVKNAGGEMRRLSDGKPLRFDTVRERMPSYVTIGDRRLGKKLFPEV
jgi:3'(2'), 5'-bisphosphate nucleotidase